MRTPPAPPPPPRTARFAAGLAFALGLAALLGAGPPRAGRPVPSLARWESNLRGHNTDRSFRVKGPEAYAAAFGPSSPLGYMGGDNHYDPIRVFYEGLDYARARRAAGDRSWDAAPFAAAVAAAVRQYRDLYLVPNACRATGYFAYNAGLTRHYVETGDPASRDAALLMSTSSACSDDASPLAMFTSFEVSREVAFSILMRLDAEDLGQAHRGRTDQFAALAMGHIDQWTAARRPPCLHVRPFMVGLTLEALIAYHDRYRDPAIPPKVKQALDWLRAHAWDPGHGGTPGTGTFVLTDIDVNRLDPVACAGHGYSADPYEQRIPAPDLSLLIAPAYAWYYQYSGDPTYRAWADEAWAGSSGVASAPLSQKVYNQSFRWSWKYLEWRSRGNTPWPAAVALTLSAPDPPAGRANAPGAPFRVAFAGPRRSTRGPAVVTPSDGGKGGTFFPTSLRLTADEPWAIFRYRPAAGASGPLTISVTNAAKLADPPPVTYTARGSAPRATGYTVTGPRSVHVGRPAAFTVALAPEGAAPPEAADPDGGLVAVDLTDPADRGAFLPNVGPGAGRVWFSADRPSMTFTHTPRAAGEVTVRFRNAAGLADPPELKFTAAPMRADRSYRPRPGDRAVLLAPAGPDLTPALGDLAAYRAHAASASAADGRSRLEALRAAGKFDLAPGGSGVEVLRLLRAAPGDTAVEVRFTDGPLQGRVALVPAPYVTRPAADPPPGG